MVRIAAIALLAAGLSACTKSPVGPPEIERTPAPGTVRVQGQLTGDGVECPALRADDGTLYTLLGDLSGFKPGDQVVVEGTRIEISFCMQGTTLQVRQIGRRAAGG